MYGINRFSHDVAHIATMGFYQIHVLNARVRPNDADGMTDSVDPNQTVLFSSHSRCIVSIIGIAHKTISF